MAQDSVRPPLKEFLDMLADLVADKYFERVDERVKKIPELKRLISAKEAAQYMSLSPDTLYRMASQKKLPYLKIGDRVLFDVKALDHWIDRHTVRGKGWKRQELKSDMEERKFGPERIKESDFMDLLKDKEKS
jgi:excisionase family DNA binding protein